MSNEDHQYALDEDGEWVNAKQTKYSSVSSFYCECPQRHKMKLVKPSGLAGKRPFCDYFAHVQSGWHKKQKTDGTSISCAPGGESWQHRKAKHQLREMVGKYYFPTFRCQDCCYERIMDTIGCSVLMERCSEDRLWRYDCLLMKDSLPVVAMEVFYKHQTGAVKTHSVRASGLEIAEFRADDVLRMPKETRTKLENLKMQRGRCQDCLLKASYCWLRDCFCGELYELIHQEDSLFDYYTSADKKRKERDRRLDLIQGVLQINDICQKFWCDHPKMKDIGLLCEHMLQNSPEDEDSCKGDDTCKQSAKEDDNSQQKRKRLNEQDLVEKSSVLEARTKAGEYVLTFGKHKNEQLNQVPIGYVRWILGVRQEGRKFHHEYSDQTTWVRTNVMACFIAAQQFMAWRCWACGIQDTRFKHSKLCTDCWRVLE